MGILVFKSEFDYSLYPFNLLLMFCIVALDTRKNKPVSFLLFTVIVFMLGFVVEVIGVNTGCCLAITAMETYLGIKWK